MNWRKQETEQLVQSFVVLETAKEARAYLRDLLTEGEIEDLAGRLQAARMLSEKVPYPAIQKATGFSTTTIARVSKWLQEGMGGYALILNRLHHHAPILAGRGSH